MIDVSNGWKENQLQAIVNRSYIGITFKITDTSLYNNGNASSSDQSTISNVSNVFKYAGVNVNNYLTLEQNRWLLDGNGVMLPNGAITNNAYSSNGMSLANLTFTNNPIIEISFSSKQTSHISAITISFDTNEEEYAKEFIVTSYDNNNVVYTETITDNNSSKYVLSHDFTGYTKITLEIVKWCLPYHRARVNEIFLGLKKEFDNASVIKYSYNQSISPIGVEKSNTEVSFSIDNTDNTFNPDMAGSLYPYLKEKQEIEVKYGFKINGEAEFIDYGKYYLTDWQTPQNELSATFTAKDLFSYLDGQYVFGKYNANGETMFNLATDVLTKANLPLNIDGSHRWVIDDSLKNIRTTAPLPICTYAEALQYIAQVSQCVCFCDKQGLIRIEPINSELTDYTISKFNSYKYPELTLQKILKDVCVKSYTYYADATLKTIFSGKLPIGQATYVLTYDQPSNLSNYYITGSYVSASLVAYTNCALLTINCLSECSITITGYNLLSSTTDVITNNENTGEEQIVDNPLIDSVSYASTIGTWVKNWLVNRKMVDTDFRIDPRVETLDKVNVENKFTTNDVVLTNIKIDYNGSFDGTAQGRVIE